MAIKFGGGWLYRATIQKNGKVKWVKVGKLPAAAWKFSTKTKKGKKMPRYHRVPRQPKVKKPKPVKLVRPKTKDLRMILKGLLTVSQSNRIASLSYALQWYDAALPYLIQKGQLDAKAQKLLAIAVKCRKQGIGATIDHEKEAAFMMALRQYEKACPLLKPPAVDKFYDTFKAKKDKLEAKQQRLENKFGNVTTLLQKAIGDRIKIQVADSQKPFQYDPGLTSLTYNREATKMLALKFRNEGLFAVLTDQLDILARHAALESDGKGGWSYDPERHVTIVNEMLASFITFAKTPEAPKKLIRAGVTPQPKAPKAPKALCAICNGTGILPDGTPCTCSIPKQRGPRVSAKGPRYLGFLVPGTAIGLVYERLMDEKEHDMGEVIAGLSTSDPVGRVKQLGRYGIEKAVLDLHINGQKVSIKHRPGVTPGSKS